MANIPSDNIQVRSGHVFPDLENIPFSEKQKAPYNYQMMKAFYAQYATDRGDMQYSRVDNYVDTLRDIAQGRQSVDQYMDFLSGGGEQYQTVLSDIDTVLQSNAKASKNGWFVGYQKALSVIPNMMTRCKGEFLKNDVDIKAFCTDVDANTEEIKRMNKEWVKNNPKTKRVLNFLRSQVNLPQHEESYVDTYDALVDIKNEGGFKERYLVAVDQVVSHTEDVSDWKQFLSEENFEDIFILGSAINFLEYDYTECKVVWKHVDIKDSIKQYGSRKDGKDAQYAGYFEYPSLNKIREIQDSIVNAETGKVGLNQDDFNQIGDMYKNYRDNLNSHWHKGKTSEQDEIDIKTCVLKVRWIDVEKRKETEYTNKGRTSRIPYKEGHEKNKAYKIIETRELKRYDCEWLVGTPYIWGFGTAKNQIFVGGKPSLGVAFFKTKEESYIERLVPIAHLFAISWLKFVNYMAKSQKSFVAVDISKLMQYSDGEKKMDPITALQLMRQELVLFFQGDEHTGGDNFPVKTIPGVETEHLMAELNTMEQLLRVAEYITGLSPLTLGATPQSSTPVRTALASLNSSNVALSYIMNAVMIMKTQLAEQTIPAVSNLLEADPKSRKYYSKVIGSDDVKSLMDNRYSLNSLGIKQYPRPSEDMKERIVQNMQFVIQQGLIDIVTATKLEYQLFHGGNFMEVLHKLEYKIRQEKDRQFKEKQALIKEQSDGNAQAAQVQAQSAQAIEQARMQADANKENQRGIAQMLIDENKFMNDVKGKYIEDKMAKGESVDKILADLELAKEQRRSQLQSA